MRKRDTIYEEGMAAALSSRASLEGDNPYYERTWEWRVWRSGFRYVEKTDKENEELEIAIIRKKGNQ